jgi:hypothetical protein
MNQFSESNSNIESTQVRANCLQTVVSAAAELMQWRRAARAGRAL